MVLEELDGWTAAPGVAVGVDEIGVYVVVAAAAAAAAVVVAV